MAVAQDDGYREIQLSGKQLVFWFMAGVVILVVVFLMGMQVGRGVLMARGAPGADATASARETEPPPPPASATPSSSTLPSTAGEKLSYAERLGSAEPPKETLKAGAPPAAPPSPKEESPDPAPKATTAATSTAKPAAAPSASAPAPALPASVAEPAGPGFAIQVAALREPDEAAAIVKRLAGKGYPAYVVAPSRGEAPIYRVRVGKFKERREADSVAARLQKEEQFKPWIVR